MFPVSFVAKQTKQPYGGFLPIRLFSREDRGGGFLSLEDENIEPGLVGSAVDYLTRLACSAHPREVFRVSLKGAFRAEGAFGTGEIARSEGLLSKIGYIHDEETIFNACRLVGYDAMGRGFPADYFRPVDSICPDKKTVGHISTMVKRSLDLLHGDAGSGSIYSGMTFRGGYSKKVSTGDADFLTENTLWDFKVSTKDPNSSHTLQILMYYCMGLRSVDDQKYKNIKRLGFYNPRKDRARCLETKNIPEETIRRVCDEVIEYSEETSSL